MTPAALALLAAPAAANHRFDNIYTTDHTTWSCTDRTLEHSGAWYCRTDNRDWTAYRQGSINNPAVVQDIVNSQFAAPTGLTITWHTSSSVRYENERETDVIFQSGPIPHDSQAGWTWCNDAVTATRCDQHYARFESSYPAKALICHETGHSVGMTHGQQANETDNAYRLRLSNTDPRLGCMQKPYPSTNTGQLGDAGTHNLAEDYAPTSAAAAQDPYKE